MVRNRNPGKILLFKDYCGVSNFDRYETGDTYNYNVYDFRYLSAHEFGHAIGLLDAYSTKYNETSDIVSIMNNQNAVRGIAQQIDYAVLLYAKDNNLYRKIFHSEYLEITAESID